MDAVRSMMSLDRYRRLLGGTMSLLVLVGLHLAVPVTIDRQAPLQGSSNPFNEDDESAPGSEADVAIELALAQREPGQHRSERRPLMRVQFNLRSPGIEATGFRPRLDHFSNGLGTPYRC